MEKFWGNNNEGYKTGGKNTGGWPSKGKAMEERVEMETICNEVNIDVDHLSTQFDSTQLSEEW